MAAQPRDHRRVRDADPEQKPSAGLLGKGALAVRHRHRIARVDVRDARRDDQVPRIGEQPGRMHQHVATTAFRQPQRGISPAFDPPIANSAPSAAVSASIGAQTPSLPSCITRPDRLGSLPKTILAAIRPDWARLHPDFCKAIFFARPGNGARQPTHTDRPCLRGRRAISTDRMPNLVSDRLCRPGRLRTGHPAPSVLRRALHRLAAGLR